MMDLRERLLEYTQTESLEETIRAALEAHMRNMWTTMPVTLSENSDGKTVKAKLNVKIKQRDADGNVTTVELPELDLVPIQFAAGGNTTSTLPLKKDNEGMVVFASRATDGWREQGGQQEAVDTRSHHLSDAFFIPGVRNKTRELPDYNTEAAETRSDDGKHRVITHPQHGVKASVNNGSQVLDVNATTKAIEATAKTLTLKSGAVQPGTAPNTPNATDRDLNEQLKGIAARLGQLEKTTHALFDVTSRLRELTQMRVPEVAALASLLNKEPSGLDAIVGAIEGKALSYLKTQIQQGLGMFLNPTIGSIGSVTGGAESLIAGLQAQIESLIAANPVVAVAQDLQRQIDGVLARSASAEVTAAAIRLLDDQIAALAAANPVIGVVQDLQAKIKSLIGSAGAGLNFLEPQQRLVKGVTKSLHISGGA